MAIRNSRLTIVSHPSSVPSARTLSRHDEEGTVVLSCIDLLPSILQECSEKPQPRFWARATNGPFPPIYAYFLSGPGVRNANDESALGAAIQEIRWDTHENGWDTDDFSGRSALE
jgi:hypothetical protein